MTDNTLPKLALYQAELRPDVPETTGNVGKLAVSLASRNKEQSAKSGLCGTQEARKSRTTPEQRSTLVPLVRR